MGEKTLKVEIDAFYPIPTSFSKAKQALALSMLLRPTTKPDCDNIIKAVLDALNGVAYCDDKQVISVSCNKFYGETGHLTVTVEEIKLT